jgi:hypothetical protein
MGTAVADGSDGYWLRGIHTPSPLSREQLAEVSKKFRARLARADGMRFDASDREICYFAKYYSCQANSIIQGHKLKNPAANAVELFLQVQLHQRARFGCEAPPALDFVSVNFHNKTSRKVQGRIYRRKQAAHAARLLPRLQNELWWRYQLRRMIAKRVEADQIRRCVVSRKAADLYISRAGFERIAERKLKNRELLQTLTATNELGHTVNLGDCVDASLANPYNRFSELMVRAKGLEELAHQRDDKALFVTITLPTEWHAVKSQTGRTNPAWQNFGGKTPKEAQAELTQRWAQFRAYLKKNNIGMYGLRIAEAHHDETPHWHICLICNEGDRQAIIRALWLYFLPDRYVSRADLFDEIDTAILKQQKTRIDATKAVLKDRVARMNAKHRIKVVNVRRDEKNNRLGIASYLTKYLAKNLDARQLRFRMDHDAEFGGTVLNAENPMTAAERVQHWASVWSVRQFQFFGLPAIGVWRELRRMKEASDSPVIEAARFYADKSNYADHVLALGGIGAKPTLKLWKGAPTLTEEAISQDGEVCTLATYEFPKNRYAEDITSTLIGVAANDGSRVVTRPHIWSVDRLGLVSITVTTSKKTLSSTPENTPLPEQLYGYSPQNHHSSPRRYADRDHDCRERAA